MISKNQFCYDHNVLIAPSATQCDYYTSLILLYVKKPLFPST